jgi:hypothetical protein
VHTIFKVLGYFSLGMAMLGLAATLFGNAGLWGFLVFVLGVGFGSFWLILGFAVRKAGRLREVLFPSTPEATLRRRLMLATFKASVRSEANAALDRLRRLEHVWPAIQRHLRARLSPSELTFQRYEGTARRAWSRALQELEDATSLVESLAVLDTSPPGSAQAARPVRDDPRLARRQRLKMALAESERAVAALERLDLALVSDLRTGTAARSDDLDALAAELDRLASRARSYSSHG